MTNIQQLKYQSCKVRSQEQARVYHAIYPGAWLYLELLHFFFHRLPNLNPSLGLHCFCVFPPYCIRILKGSPMSYFSFVFLARSSFTHVPLLVLVCHCLLAPPFYPSNGSNCLDLASLRLFLPIYTCLFEFCIFFITGR